MLTSSPSWGGDLRVQLLLSEESAPYRSFAEVLGKELPASVRLVVPGREVQGGRREAADLVIAVGVKAAETALIDTAVPVLAVMVPKSAYENLLLDRRVASGVSGIYLDQPWGRQIDFVYAIFPELERIGLLYSAESRLEVAPLLNHVAARGGSVVAQSVRSADSLFSSLEKVLVGSEVLLAIPDSRIYNAASIRNILLTSYRHDVPLIGFSQGYVNAGALAAIFSTPEQLAAQTARLVVAFELKRELPAPRYPGEFSLALNPQVARSLGIRLPSETDIRKRMRGETAR